MVPAEPSPRGTSFHPVPLQSVQFSRAMVCVVAGLKTGKLFLALDRIRSSTAHSKFSALGKLWKELLVLLSETHYRLLLTEKLSA
jgi:hypothetical protein